MRHPNPQQAPRIHWPQLALTLGMAVPILLVFATLPWPFGRHGHPPGSTQNRMKQWGLIFKMYANESKDNLWPPLARNGQLWTPDLAQLYPDYLSPANIDLLVAREHPDRDAIRTILQTILKQPNYDYDTAAGLMGLSFGYVGYAVMDDAGFKSVYEARQKGFLEGTGTDFEIPGESAQILPLREGIERFLTTFQVSGPYPPSKTQEYLPVLVEIANWRYRGPARDFPGANVLYMDGHVKHVPLGTFPVIPEVMDILSGIKAAPYRDNSVP